MKISLRDTMIYTAKHTFSSICSIEGKDLPDVANLSFIDISRELDAIGTSVELRLDGVSPDVLSSVATSAWFSECEHARVHDLKMALPSQAELMADARTRNLIRRANRKRIISKQI